MRDKRAMARLAEQASQRFHAAYPEIVDATRRFKLQAKAKQEQRCLLCNTPPEPLTELWGDAYCERCHLLVVLRGEGK